MALLREKFRLETAERERLGEETGGFFDCAFRYLEEALGESQELVIFVTEVTAGYDTSWFVENFGCEAYYRHNRGCSSTRPEAKSAGRSRSWAEAGV